MFTFILADAEWILHIWPESVVLWKSVRQKPRPQFFPHFITYMAELSHEGIVSNHRWRFLQQPGKALNWWKLLIEFLHYPKELLYFCESEKPYYWDGEERLCQKWGLSLKAMILRNTVPGKSSILWVLSAIHKVLVGMLHLPIRSFMLIMPLAIQFAFLPKIGCLW